MILEEREEMNELKRFCADCKTTRTPLWRTGPYGPRSLCNACGIRYRKRKTADDSIIAEMNSEKSSSSNRSGDHQEIQMDDSEKEMIAQTQRPFSSCSSSSSSSSQLKKQRSRRDSSINSNSSSLKFSEVEEAAVLLMSMSCNSVFA